MATLRISTPAGLRSLHKPPAVVLGTLVGLNVGGVREQLFGVADAARIESIAVLPLENLTGDPDQDEGT